MTSLNGPRMDANIVVLGTDNVGKSALIVRFLTRRFIGEYGDIDGFVLVYSICDRSSFNAVSRLLQIIKSTKDFLGFEKMPIVIVGNKRDLHHRRTVLSEEGRLLALSADCQFYEVSAAENYHSVLMVFHGLMDRIRESRVSVKKLAGIKGIVKSMSAVFARRRTDSL
ncbi:hypothetical protein cypCar_00038707 [Cyprinus carpio]|nr:hypothetical protein cypCar_00038707 [Cyprinus carpio]